MTKPILLPRFYLREILDQVHGIPAHLPGGHDKLSNTGMHLDLQGRGGIGFTRWEEQVGQG